MKEILLCTLVTFHFFIFVRTQTNLVSMVIENMMDCVAQAPENFSMETCQEMINPKNDNRQAKYKDCKCVAACTGKNLGLIDENGNKVPEKLKYYAGTLEKDSMWKKEADVIIEKCKDTPGKGCDLAWNWITCALTNSEKSLEFIKAFASGGGTDLSKNK